MHTMHSMHGCPANRHLTSGYIPGSSFAASSFTCQSNTHATSIGHPRLYYTWLTTSSPHHSTPCSSADGQFLCDMTQFMCHSCIPCGFTIHTISTPLLNPPPCMPFHSPRLDLTLFCLTVLERQNCSPPCFPSQIQRCRSSYCLPARAFCIVHPHSIPFHSRFHCFAPLSIPRRSNILITTSVPTTLSLPACMSSTHSRALAGGNLLHCYCPGREYSRLQRTWWVREWRSRFRVWRSSCIPAHWKAFDC